MAAPGSYLKVSCFTVKKKGPDYSSVTARESLANIRERQAAEMRAQNPQDAMYETVNYDAVKVRTTFL